jgi:DUF971 family protein
VSRTGRTSISRSCRETTKPPDRLPNDLNADIGDPSDRERPLDILADRARRLLTIQWADEHQSAYDFELLRWNCPCAECAGEAGLPGKLASTSELTDDQVDLDQMEPVGLFGIRPYWKDGHNTGIFGLSLLRAICPCEECVALRSRK